MNTPPTTTAKHLPAPDSNLPEAAKPLPEAAKAFPTSKTTSQPRTSQKQKGLSRKNSEQPRIVCCQTTAAKTPLANHGTGLFFIGTTASF